MTPVRPGQVWKDNDKRMSERFVRVLRIEGDKAICVRCGRGIGSGFHDIGMARSTKISIRRFKPTSTGYILVSPRPEAS